MIAPGILATFRDYTYVVLQVTEDEEDRSARVVYTRVDANFKPFGPIYSQELSKFSSRVSLLPDDRRSTLAWSSSHPALPGRYVCQLSDPLVIGYTSTQLLWRRDGAWFAPRIGTEIRPLRDQSLVLRWIGPLPE